MEIEWHEIEAGAAAIEQYGTQLPEHVLRCIRTDRVALKGPVTTPIGTGFTSANVACARRWTSTRAFAPCATCPASKSRSRTWTWWWCGRTRRISTPGIEHEVVPGVVESLKIITERASTRIASSRSSTRAGRPQHVTAVHKANIMKLTDGLFLGARARWRARYPEIQYTEMIVDAACMQLVMDPERFDMLVLENLYGDIVSDLCAGLVGGLGVVRAANIGDENAVFEAVHGSAPDIAGKGVANPTAMILSA